jgi:hypothetical protein
MHTPWMPDYRRNRVPGGTFFFTVNLLDRRSNPVGDEYRRVTRRSSPSARPRTFSHRRLGRPPRPHTLSVDVAASRPSDTVTPLAACADPQVEAECASLFRPTLAARVTDGGAVPLLQRLAPIYIGPGAEYPLVSMRNIAGYVTRMTPPRFSRIGPWAQQATGP